MKRIIKFLKTDIKIINSYLLFTIILIILVCVGYSSYALFSFTKTSNNVIEGTVGELKKSGVDTLIKLTDNTNDSGLYTITHPADNTLQIGATESVTEYRYRGANPKNYVTFNNEVWRILGVFPTDDGTGKIENRIKLIRNESIGNKKWTSAYSNNWVGSTLKKELNETYLNSLTSEAQSMIGNAKYYLGGATRSNITKDVMYSNERQISGNMYYAGTNPTNWVGKVAVMYASDYGYAVPDICTQNLNTYKDDTTNCVNTNWLYNIKVTEWVLNQVTKNAYVFNIYGGNYINSGGRNVTSSYAVRPTLYLKPNVQIMDGDGTSTNPYVFALDGKVVLPTIDEFSVVYAGYEFKVTQGTYPIESYCTLDNDSNIDNCNWVSKVSSCATEKGNSTNIFYLFVKDKKGNIVSKSYETYIGMVDIC